MLGRGAASYSLFFVLRLQYLILSISDHTPAEESSLHTVRILCHHTVPSYLSVTYATWVSSLSLNKQCYFIRQCWAYLVHHTRQGGSLQEPSPRQRQDLPVLLSQAGVRPRRAVHDVGGDLFMLQHEYCRPKSAAIFGRG